MRGIVVEPRDVKNVIPPATNSDASAAVLGAAIILGVAIVGNAIVVSLVVWYVRSRIAVHERWRFFLLRGFLVAAACFLVGVPIFYQMWPPASLVAAICILFAPAIGATVAAVTLRHRQSVATRWRKTYSEQ